MNHASIDRAVSRSIREIVFGLEDSLVSTLGTVTGIAAATQSGYVVIASGLVLIAVEAVSMAAGSYLSSKSAASVEKANHLHHKEAGPIQSAFVMGIFYVLGGLFPLAPYFFLSVSSAFVLSIILTVTMLVLTGMGVAHVTDRPAWRTVLEMVSVSLLAAAIGYGIGKAISAFFGIDVIG